MTFVTPDFSAPLNWTERLAVLPPDANARGMFLADLQNDLLARGKPLPNKKTYISFKTYPLTEYLEFVRYAAECLYPGVPPRAAIRQLGQTIYPRFEQTIVGKSIFAFAGNSFSSIVKLAAKAYQVSVNYGRVGVRELHEGYAIVELREMFALPDILQVGNWEGAMQVAKVQGDIKIRVHSSSDVDFEIRWS